MNKIYYEEYNNRGYTIKVSYYTFADNSVYRIEKTYLNGKEIRTLLCRALDKISDYKKWDKQYYVKAGKVFFPTVVRKATDSLDYMKVDNGKYTVAFEPNVNLIYTLRSVYENGLS